MDTRIDTCLEARKRKRKRKRSAFIPVDNSRPVDNFHRLKSAGSDASKHPTGLAYQSAHAKKRLTQFQTYANFRHMQNDQENQGEKQRPSLQRTGPSSQIIRAATAAAVRGLVSTGLPVTKACEILGISTDQGYRIMKKADPQGKGVSSLISAERNEKLAKMLDNFLEQGVKMRKIKGSDAIAAAKLYADRAHPARQDQTPGAVNFVKVDITVYERSEKTIETEALTASVR